MGTPGYLFLEGLKLFRFISKGDYEWRTLPEPGWVKRGETMVTRCMQIEVPLAELVAFPSGSLAQLISAVRRLGAHEQLYRCVAQILKFGPLPSSGCEGATELGVFIFPKNIPYSTGSQGAT